MPKQQHVLTLELNDDPELIRLYEQYHQPGAVWPEVLESIRASGIENMQIYRLGSLLVMVLQVNAAFSFEAKSEADKNNPKVQEWETLMERFQRVSPDQNSAGKWHVMDQLFQLIDH
ncbi:MAG: L-rhamnose mutarotase [Paraglaciecola sp.]|uniref:L-rhamnose mutarotase n=1 Tax=Paraglaciecola sp. TaxID=1920173 RepID=UPI0032973E2E